MYDHVTFVAAGAGPGCGAGGGAVRPAGGAVQPGAAEGSVQRGGESLQCGEREEQQHGASPAEVNLFVLFVQQKIYRLFGALGA